MARETEKDSELKKEAEDRKMCIRQFSDEYKDKIYFLFYKSMDLVIAFLIILIIIIIIITIVIIIIIIVNIISLISVPLLIARK